MKIGWAKLTMAMEIDYNNASAGLGEERPMLFKSLLECGHSLKLLTSLKKNDTRELENAIAGTCSGVVNNSWMKGLEYKPEGFADNCDVLIVENGPLNITFIDHFTNQPQIRRVMEIIDKFEGLVIWYQTDPLLPFPFWRLAMSERQWSDSENNVRNKRAAVEADGWGDKRELFNNKKILCLGKCINKDIFAEEMNGERFRYKYFENEGLIKFDYFPTGYDHYFLPHIQYDWRQKVYPLTYIGFPRSRISSFRKFYEPFCENLHVYGPWDADSLRQSFLNEFRNKGMRWYGYSKGYLEITKMYDESLCCINLLPNKAQKMGWICNRLFEGIFCGCIVLGDSETYGIERFVPNKFILNESNKADVINEVISMSQQEYVDSINEQYDMVNYLDYNYIVSYLEGLVSFYKDGKVLGETLCHSLPVNLMTVKEGEREKMVEPNIPKIEEKKPESEVPIQEKEIITTGILEKPLTEESSWQQDMKNLYAIHEQKRCTICNGAGLLLQLEGKKIACPICQGSGYAQGASK